MFKRTPDTAQNCHRRAAACRRRAEASRDPQQRAFWQGQERRWIEMADNAGFADRISIVRTGEPAPAETQPADGIETLIEVFNRVCADLRLDGHDLTLPRTIAHTIIEAALGGEDDLDKLHAYALKAVAH